MLKYTDRVALAAINSSTLLRKDNNILTTVRIKDDFVIKDNYLDYIYIYIYIYI